MQSYASAFEIVTEDKAEIEVMKIRSSLMNELVDLMNGFGLTQVEAAKIIGCTQPRISQLKNGRLSEFSLTWLTKAKLKLQG